MYYNRHVIISELWYIIIIDYMATDNFFPPQWWACSHWACRVASWSYYGNGLVLDNRECSSLDLNVLCPPDAGSPTWTFLISPAAPDMVFPCLFLLSLVHHHLAQHTKSSRHQVRLLLAQCQDLRWGEGFSKVGQKEPFQGKSSFPLASLGQLVWSVQFTQLSCVQEQWEYEVHLYMKMTHGIRNCVVKAILIN